METGHDLARAIDKAFVDSVGQTFEVHVARLRAIEKEFLFLLRDDPELQVETKRRIAEQIFLAAVTRQKPFHIGRRLFGVVRRLGFVGLYWELLYCTIFAQYCLTMNRADVGIRTLEEILRKLRKSSGPSKLCLKHDITLAQKLLKEMRKKRRDAEFDETN